MMAVCDLDAAAWSNLAMGAACAFSALTSPRRDLVGFVSAGALALSAVALIARALLP